MLGNVFNMPLQVGLLLKSIRPFWTQTLRDGPAEGGVPQTHADQMSLGGTVVNKLIATVYERQVINEVNITGPSRESELGRTGDGVNCI